MKVGVVAEIKDDERRVGLTPSSVHELVDRGHHVYVERGAGVGIGAVDAKYAAAGATLFERASDVWDVADLIVKVKEPQRSERVHLRPHQILFTYLHLAPDRQQVLDLLGSGAICVGYETVTDERGRLPLLSPMSQIAGRMSIQAGATALQAHYGGAGILLGGVPGVPAANVVVLGGGVVGENAIQMAIGLGAVVTVIDQDVGVLERLAARFPGVRTLFSTRETIAEVMSRADVAVGAVLRRGGRAPRLITTAGVKSMRAGSVVVDVAIDQGGCFETSRPTTHRNPTFLCGDVVHYCVANMPGAVPRTATIALNNVTLPYVKRLADSGVAALRIDPYFRAGVNVCAGAITERNVALSHGCTYVEPLDALDSITH